MVKRQTLVGIVSLPMLALLLIGCPKRPTATGGAPSAPAPSVPAASTLGTEKVPAVPVPAGPVVAGVPRGGVTPPVPGEFMIVGALKAIHFDFDRYDIRPGDAKVLEENARWMKANPDHLVLIEGHADERGTNEYNLALGERRAKSAMTYLISQGVQASRLTTISYGEERPLCSEKKEECWTQNRRAGFLATLR